MKFLILLSLVASAFPFSCKDQNNKDVDWFAAYKMPKLTDSSIAGVKDGYGFYYLDVNAKSKLVASANDLQSKNQAIAYTLQQWYDVQKDTSIFHVMYNDEPYGTKSTIMEALLKNNTILPENRVEYGHTKGTVFFNAQTGVWLIHSVPKFPNPTTYEYPVSGTDYGQTMLCITFKYSELSNIGTQLFYNHPDIYSSQLPTSMASANPDLANVIGGTFKKGTPYTSTIDLTSAAGIRFRSFAKNADFNQDLYDGLVASGIKTDIQVESWRRGDEVPLDCAASYKVADALNIKVGQSMEFKYTKDHSKLARSTKSTVPYVCIGDVNRMTSQYVRGGGTVCLNDPFVWQAFDVVTAEKQECT